MDVPERNRCADHVALQCRQFLTITALPTVR
jgi:hypothetical protein